YHTAVEIKDRLAVARDRGIELHVWARKEIENYFLVTAAIARAIGSEASAGPSEADVMQELDRIVRALRNDTMDAIATENLARDKPSGLGPANRADRERLAKAWKSFEGRLSIVSGKDVLRQIFAWSQKAFGVSLNVRKIARQLRRDDLDLELVSVVGAIEKRRAFESG